MTLRLLLLLALLPAACATTPNAAPPAQDRQLIVHVLGVKRESGRVPVALWASNETFLHSGEWAASGSAPAAVPDTIVDLGRVNCGRYALSAFHDRYDTGTLRRNSFGIPVDPWAFSGAPVLFGPPTFEGAAFMIDPGDEPLVVELHLGGAP